MSGVEETKTAGAAPAKAEETPAPEKKTGATLADFSKAVTYIIKGVETSQPRLIQRAIRQNAPIRKFVTKDLLLEAISAFVPLMCPTFDAMVAAANKLPDTPKESSTEDSEMKVEEASAPAMIAPPPQVLPEVEVFIFTTIVTTLLREKCDADAAFSATILVERIRSFNRRSLDLLSSKSFFYFSLAYEKVNKLENIRPTLLALYRTTCIRHDDMGQAVLLNLLLRNYLHYDLVEQAQTLSIRTAFPEGASNNQFCRYLYYMGRVQAIQLEYSDAYQRLMMAVRKAPQDCAQGFTIMVHKLAVIVQLLMGDVPERSLFNQKELRVPLKPYLSLTQSVRTGDLQQFNEVVRMYGPSFRADKNMTLVHRLGHNVLKTGLRKLSLSYSRISIADVAAKLHLPSPQGAEYICAKAIRDGVIEATIDHENQWLLSKEAMDVYSTEEPQKAFHKRIAFTLDVYNEAIKSMRYPPDAYKRELAQTKDKDKDNKEDEKTIEELIKEMEEEDMD